MKHAPLAEVTRGDHIESSHAGSVAVVDAQGNLLYYAGDPDFPTFTRSTLKPFQALPLLLGGGAAHFGITPVEIALLCASHSGEAKHVAAVQSILDKIGCTEKNLRCGCHAPLYLSASHPGSAAISAWNQLHNNCSGKHAGFLAYCMQHHHPLDTYLDLAHPLQRSIRACIAEHCGIDESALVAGIDGCSAPNYAMPLSRLALGYARLAQHVSDVPSGSVFKDVFAAMTRYPDMVSGTARFDLAAMQTIPGDWVAKGGAEGVQAIGIHSAGIGIAIKVADGNARALYPAAVSVLQQLDLLQDSHGSPLASWSRPQLTNLMGMRTGEIRATVKLIKA